MSFVADSQRVCRVCGALYTVVEGEYLTHEDLCLWVSDLENSETVQSCRYCNVSFLAREIERHENVCVFDTTGFWDEDFDEPTSDVLYDVISSDTKHNQRFGLTSFKKTFKLRPVPDNTDPIDWLRRGIHGVMTDVMESTAPTDMLGACISSVHLKEPAWCAFKTARDMQPTDILEVLESVIQSNQLFFHTDTMTLEITRVRMPHGSGRKVGKDGDFDRACLSKRSITTIQNTDNLCLPRALVVGKALAKHDLRYNCIKRNIGKIQDRLALKLMNKAKVQAPETGGMGLNEVSIFQKHLKKYQITVYDFEGRGRNVLFKGVNPDAQYKINLIYGDCHFNVINSLTGAFACCYYYEECNTPYNNKTAHVCSQKCSACFSSPPCLVEAKLSCKLCKRTFNSKNCFNIHKVETVLKRKKKTITTSTCRNIRKCLKCYKVYDLSRRRPKIHTCGEIFCTVCFAFTTPDHRCYMKVNANIPSDENVLFIFFDLETRQEKNFQNNPSLKEHEPNACVVQQVCYHCEDNDNVTDVCYTCGVRQHVYIGDNVIQQFLNYLLIDRPKLRNVICLAHNGSAFDNQFILKALVNHYNATPEVVMRGTKIISLKYQNIRFLDSLNYLPMPLSSLPKAFNLVELKKGYFPYRFNTWENQNYVGPMPPVEFYDPDSMRSSDRDKFLAWYDSQVSNNVVFNMEDELRGYTINDVTILRQACLAFRKIFLEYCNVCPFSESAITIASAVNLCYRRNFLEPNTIELIPRGGYRCRDNQSFSAIKWLLTVEKLQNIKIKHAFNGHEVILPGTKLKVDGFCGDTNQVFEYNGCFYHGHTCIKSNRDSPIYPGSSDTLNKRLESTRSKALKIKSMGYDLIEIWECEFKNYLKVNPDIELWLNSNEILKMEPLNLRESFFGGRTGNTKLYYKCGDGERIHYYDVCSLYPWVTKYGIFPIKEPKIYVGFEECYSVIISDPTLKSIHGIMKCTILPPRSLYFPVLPVKLHNKLFFPLCRTCAETLNQEDCFHTDEERMLHGVWVILEVAKALEMGYKLVDTWEIYTWETVQYNRDTGEEGLFARYVNTFLKIKQESSGYPKDCETAEDRAEYVERYYEVEGILLDPSKIAYNPGLRTVSKTALNSQWGKFGQRNTLPKITIVNEPYDLLQILTDPLKITNYILTVNESTIYVNWCDRDENERVLTNANVVVASFVTAQARLKLYSYLEVLKERCHYFDTDSLIFSCKEGEEDLPTGNFLGDLTDELEEYGKGSFITEFVSSGPKSYAYKLYSTKSDSYKSVCKIKGLTLNFRNTQKLNFDRLKDIVLNNRDERVIVSNYTINKTTSNDVYSKTSTKTFEVKFVKRRLIDNLDSVPYGYKKP